jgi:hypothetical protein
LTGTKRGKARLAGSRKETAKETAKALELIPQPNGRGALLSGGKPGNKGGGRTRSEVRDAYLLGAEEALPVLLGHLRAEGNPDLQQQAADKFLRYGLGAVKEVTVEAVREKVQQTLDIIQGLVSNEQFMRIVRELEPVWSK